MIVGTGVSEAPTTRGGNDTRLTDLFEEVQQRANLATCRALQLDNSHHWGGGISTTVELHSSTNLTYSLAGNRLALGPSSLSGRRVSRAPSASTGARPIHTSSFLYRNLTQGSNNPITAGIELGLDRSQ